MVRGNAEGYYSPNIHYYLTKQYIRDITKTRSTAVNSIFIPQGGNFCLNAKFELKMKQFFICYFDIFFLTNNETEFLKRYKQMLVKIWKLSFFLKSKNTHIHIAFIYDTAKQFKPSYRQKVKLCLTQNSKINISVWISFCIIEIVSYISNSTDSGL